MNENIKEEIHVIEIKHDDPNLRGCGRNSNGWISALGSYRIHPSDPSLGLIFVWSASCQYDRQTYRFLYSFIKQNESDNLLTEEDMKDMPKHEPDYPIGSKE